MEGAEPEPFGRASEQLSDPLAHLARGLVGEGDGENLTRKGAPRQQDIDSDGTVPFEGSGKRTHEAIAGSELHLIPGGPHGCNVSHADEFNQALITFLAK